MRDARFGRAGSGIATGALVALIACAALAGAVHVAPVAGARLKPSPSPTPTPAPTSITWSGATWSVKTSTGPVGPGPNVFSASNVSVDGDGYLHLRIASPRRGKWTTAEIVGATSFGYGTYTWTLGSRTDALDPNVVLGLFTWSDLADYAHRELDIEFSRWSNASDPTNAQYVVQPWDGTNHLRRFTQPAATTSTHAFTWAAGSIHWESRDAGGNLIDQTTYTGSDVPIPGDERVRLNLWLYQGRGPSDGLPAEVIVRSFSYSAP